MKKQQSGVIVNIGSVAGTTGIGSSIPYAATKSAIHTMTRSSGAVDTRWWSGNEEKIINLQAIYHLREFLHLMILQRLFFFN